MNMKVRFLFIYLLLIAIGSASAQNTRSTEVKQPAPRYQAYKKEKKGLFSFLKKKNKEPQLKSLEDEKLAFRKRVSEAYWENEKVNYKTQKVKKKEAKKGKKFHGHKRPPKKRPVGKQKFCKVCRIRH